MSKPCHCFSVGLAYSTNYRFQFFILAPFIKGVGKSARYKSPKAEVSEEEKTLMEVGSHYRNLDY